MTRPSRTCVPVPLGLVLILSCLSCSIEVDFAPVGWTQEEEHIWVIQFEGLKLRSSPLHGSMGQRFCFLELELANPTRDPIELVQAQLTTGDSQIAKVQFNGAPPSWNRVASGASSRMDLSWQLENGLPGGLGADPQVT